MLVFFQQQCAHGEEIEMNGECVIDFSCITPDNLPAPGGATTAVLPPRPARTTYSTRSAAVPGIPSKLAHRTNLFAGEHTTQVNLSTSSMATFYVTAPRSVAGAVASSRALLRDGE